MERQSKNSAVESEESLKSGNAAEFEIEMKNWLVERAKTVAEMKKELEPLLEFEDFFNKLLVNSDSDVGKSSVYYCYVSDNTSKQHHPPPPDSEVHDVKVGGEKVRVAIWEDAAGSSRRTISKELLSSYQKRADGILMVYDVTKRDTFTNICNLVAEESDFFSSKFKMVVGVLGRKGIKIDQEGNNCKEELSKLFGEDIQCVIITECGRCDEKSNRTFRLCLEDLVSKVLHDRMLKADQRDANRPCRPFGARLCKVFKCITEKLFSVGKQ